MRNNFWARLFSFPAMLITILLCAALDLWQGGPILRDPDLWWHMRDAHVLLTTHHFIRQDLYSFTTHGQPWVNPEWLAEVPYYLGFHLGGERGLFFVILMVVELVIGGVLWLCYRRSGDVKAAWLAAWVGLLFAAVNIGPRTILFGWICFLAEMMLLEDFRKGRDRMWMLAPLFALWINLHGSWLIGFVFFLIFAASGLVQGTWGSIEAVRWTPSQLRKLAAVGAASVAALFVNPYGWRLVGYPIEYIFGVRVGVGVVEEWQSVDFQNFHGKLLFAVCASMLIFTLVRRRSWPLHELLFALLALYSAVTHQRFLLLAGIILCPILAVELSGTLFQSYDSRRDKPLLNALIMAAFCYFTLRHIPTSAAIRATEGQYFPAAALPELERCCSQGRLLNRFEWGGYLIWYARDIPVYVDSRTDIFEFHGVFADYLNAITLNDSLGILDRSGIDYVLLQPTAPLVYLLKHTPGWRVQYEDGTAVLLVRADPLKRAFQGEGSASLPPRIGRDAKGETR